MIPIIRNNMGKTLTKGMSNKKVKWELWRQSEIPTEGLTQSQKRKRFPWKNNEYVRTGRVNGTEGGKAAKQSKGRRGRERVAGGGTASGGTGRKSATAETEEAQRDSKTRDEAGEAETGPFKVLLDPIKQSNSNQKPSEMFPHRGQRIRDIHFGKKKSPWRPWGRLRKKWKKIRRNTSNPVTRLFS